jgi:hemerythrin
MFITWRPELSVGIPVIDKQHRVEIDLINELHDIIVGGRGDGEAACLIKTLLDHTRFHFQYEEDVLRNHGFPDLEPHLREHRTVLNTLGGMTFSDGKGAQLLIYTLSRWLKGHIVGVDMKYGPFLRARHVV